VIVGIDLGTTYSAVATLGPDGRPTVLPNRLGEPTTPSCVSFVGPDEVLVGTLAKQQLVTDPDHAVALIKRHMGSQHPLRFHGADHTPESVSALILRALVADAAAELGRPAGEPVRAVITVPAYFGLREREATQQAAEMAGIEVLELIAEPVAAALAYRISAGGSGPAQRTLLVYDLGGGTFDCTVLRCTAGSVTVLATDGDSHLGGAEVDQRLAAALLDRLAERLPVDADHPAEDAGTVAATAAVAEAAKRHLTERRSQPVVVRHGAHVLRTEIGRDLLAQAARDLVDRTMAIVARLLCTVGPDVGIDDVVLVGGSSRLPAVAEALTARFGRSPRSLDPELAVARGAAVRAGQLAREPATGLTTGRAVTVLPRGVGVLVRDSHDPAGLREYVQHVLAANTPLPARCTTPFATIVDHQAAVRIQVFEQAGAVLSQEVGNNRAVLDGEFRGLPERPAGSRIDVTLSVGLDGRLAVAAHTDEGAPLPLEAFVQGVVDGAAAEQLTARTGAMTIRQ
jgi:molecular chaperone DnaK